MFGLAALVILGALVALLFVAFYRWARGRGLLTGGPAEPEPSGSRRVSLLTEAVAYVGAILILAGGIAAIGQQWPNISAWGRVGVFAGFAVFFLVVGLVVRGVREPAVQRLTGVVWFLSVAAFGGAIGFAAYDVFGTSGEVMTLAMGIGTSLYAAVLWLARRRALQNAALFAGLVLTIGGLIVTTTSGQATGLAFALGLWLFGLAWAALGWLRYAEPMWVAGGLGVVLALVAPSFGVGAYGWVYALAIVTAAAAMAASVPLRNVALLALGTVAMFGYVTALVVRYFQESLGVPTALAITGVLVLTLAAVSARLMRAARPAKPGTPEIPRPRQEPADLAEPEGPDTSEAEQPRQARSSHHGLPRAS